MKSTIKVLFILLSLTFLMGAVKKDKVIIGRVEWVELPELEIRFKARIDTGAKTTSVHAFDIQEVDQDGVLFVKFVIENNKGEKKELVRKIEASQKVVNPSGVTSKRYVIRETIKLGDFRKEISINLNDRGRMDYKFLVGRNLLIGNFIVDVARSHVMGDFL